MNRLFVLFSFLTVFFSCSKTQENTASQGPSSAQAIDMVPVTQEGVVFYANNVDRAFDMARAANKPVFVEVYSETCHVCQSFIPVFKEKQVSDFFNSNFLNYRIEVNSPEFQTFILGRKLVVPSLPLLLFYDANQNLVHLGMIEANGEKLVELGKTALNPSLRSASMKKRFEQGEKNPQFLIDYAMFSRVTMDTVMNRKAMEVYARQQPASSYTSETNFVAIQKILMDVENPMGAYFINNLPIYRQRYDPEMVKNVAENLVMSSLYSSFGSAYGSQKIQLMRDYLIKAGIDPQVSRNRVLLPLINAYFRENSPRKASELVNTHMTQVPLKAADYMYLIKYFNEHSPDAGYVASAQTWYTNALNTVQKNSSDEAELNYEMAVAYKKGNNSTQAAQYAQNALNLARSTGTPTAKYEALVGSI